MNQYRRALSVASGLAMLFGLMTGSVALADPSDMETFQGCIDTAQAEALALITASGKVDFNLTRMAPSQLDLSQGECVTVRAYPGAGSETSIWFAESIVAGDEKVETTGRDITKETTSDSTAKAKKKNDD
jgi:hypothetical protein